MAPANSFTGSSNSVQELVYTILDVFDAARDLHHTLRAKEKRDFEQTLRAKGYPTTRRLSFVEDDEFNNDDSIIMDKAAVKRQFEIGYQKVGPQFPMGDEVSQLALQSHIVTLQRVLITTFLYGPTSSNPISVQLSNLSKASRAAGTASVDILLAQQQRQLATPSHASRPRRSSTARTSPTLALPYSMPASEKSCGSTALERREPSNVRSGSPVNTTILDWHSGVESATTITDTMSPTGSRSNNMGQSVYCSYAMDLQRFPSQQLSSSILSDSSPHCPECERSLHLSNGRAWELFKNDKDGFERCFQVSNRFVVKSHREGPNGAYSCVLCSDNTNVETVCGDVKALIKHVWEDHDVSELKHEEDIVEVIENIERRRDSALGYDGPRSNRRSHSPRSRRGYNRPDVEHEVDAFEVRPRRVS